MARNNNKAAALVPATVAALAAAPLRGAHNLGKYIKAAKGGKSNPVASVTYKLTPLGSATASANGAGKGGKVTCMGLVCVAAAHVAAKGRPLTGANIVAAMGAVPAIAAAYAQTKASKYAPAGSLPWQAWCAGYVAGAARSAHGLLAKVTPTA